MEESLRNAIKSLVSVRRWEVAQIKKAFFFQEYGNVVIYGQIIENTMYDTNTLYAYMNIIGDSGLLQSVMLISRLFPASKLNWTRSVKHLVKFFMIQIENGESWPEQMQLLASIYLVDRHPDQISINAYGLNILTEFLTTRTDFSNLVDTDIDYNRSYLNVIEPVISQFLDYQQSRYILPIVSRQLHFIQDKLVHYFRHFAQFNTIEINDILIRMEEYEICTFPQLYKNVNDAMINNTRNLITTPYNYRILNNLIKSHKCPDNQCAICWLEQNTNSRVVKKIKQPLAAVPSAPPKESETTGICTVCLESVVAFAIVPCFHCYCTNCSEKLKICPLCRTPIERLQRIFI